MNSVKCTESVSLERKRMLQYKSFALVFSYPSDKISSVFSDLKLDTRKLSSEYDQLFRANKIWLYGAEYMAKNEFQRANYLADIMGFYKAFGVEPDKDRPDSLPAELEFMHYLIFKRIYALEHKLKNSQEKADLCLDAQKKFFKQHLYPATSAIAEKIIAQDKGFYRDWTRQLISFLEEEKKFFSRR